MVEFSDSLVREAAEAFAARLRAIRHRQKLTQAELAGRSGLTGAAISQMEQAKREPTFSSLVRLASALETTPNDLMGYDVQGDLDPSLHALVSTLKEIDAEMLREIDNYVAYLQRRQENR